MDKKGKSTRRKKLTRSYSAKYWGSSKKSQPLPDTLFYELVNKARNRTGISHAMSKAVVVTILSYLSDAVPSIRTLMEEILFQQQRLLAPDELDLSGDAIALKELLKKVAAMNGNQVQRNFGTQEDEEMVMEIVADIYDVLHNGDPEVCKLVIAEENYRHVETLVTFYQMEPRTNIRAIMIRIFGKLCFLDHKVISALVSSALPAELARDIHPDETEYGDKFYYACTLLTLLLSIEEPLPVNAYAGLNEDFMDFLFQLVETLLGTKRSIKIFGLILACNLHFPVPEENVVMNALAKVKKPDFFFEQMFFLYSIRVDLVHFIPKEGAQEAVVKILKDVFSRKDTAKQISTSKEHILIDLIQTRLRGTWNRDKINVDYLVLFLNMLRTSNYKEHRHHQAEFQQLFNEISASNTGTEDEKKAKTLIKQIQKEFPDLFPPSSFRM